MDAEESEAETDINMDIEQPETEANVQAHSASHPASVGDTKDVQSGVDSNAISARGEGIEDGLFTATTLLGPTKAC